MREIKTEIMIHAPIEEIWSRLMNFSAYSTWNPFIRCIEGTPDVNERLSVTIQPPNKNLITFHTQVVFAEEYEFIWRGHYIVPGIFDSIYRFMLLSQPDGNVRLVNSETFTGLFHIFIFRLMNETVKTGLQEMNKALKKTCESTS